MGIGPAPGGPAAAAAAALSAPTAAAARGPSRAAAARWASRSRRPAAAPAVAAGARGRRGQTLSRRTPAQARAPRARPAAPWRPAPLARRACSRRAAARASAWVAGSSAAPTRLRRPRHSLLIMHRGFVTRRDCRMERHVGMQPVVNLSIRHAGARAPGPPQHGACFAPSEPGDCAAGPGAPHAGRLRAQCGITPTTAMPASAHRSALLSSACPLAVLHPCSLVWQAPWRLLLTRSLPLLCAPALTACCRHGVCRQRRRHPWPPLSAATLLWRGCAGRVGAAWSRTRSVIRTGADHARAACCQARPRLRLWSTVLWAWECPDAGRSPGGRGTSSW
jgi:hypothetical protein